MALSDTMDSANQFPLGIRNLSRVQGWGMAVDSLSYLYQPTTKEEILEVFEIAKRKGLTVALRGGGRSYGDASINDSGIILDLSKMNQILDWNPETGIVEVEPGVNISKLWKSTVTDGYWPPVVSGTMFTTMGGCAAMNIHGKNNFKVGTFGEHILEFDFITPSGEEFTCTPEKNKELYYAAISGFGMLGCFTRLKIKLKKVHSGQLWVEAFNTSSIGNMLEEIQDRIPKSDYLVGWMDCLSTGSQFGRGVVHQAGYLPEGVDTDPKASLQIANQELPSKMFGLIPKSLMWYPLSFFVNRWGMRLVNAAKFWSGYLQPRGHRYWQSHAGFAFLLDYVPNWKWSYKPGGLIQYQVFVPKDKAEDVFTEIIRRSQKEKMPALLGVVKRHKPDPFMMTHSVDGYSLALDYSVTESKRKDLWTMCQKFDDLVIANGGKFYFAKDATLKKETVESFFGTEKIDEFFQMKKKYDPDMLLQTNIARRLFHDRLENE